MGLYKIETFNAAEELIRSEEQVFEIGGKFRFRVSDRLRQEAGSRITIKTQIPIYDLHGYWNPDLDRPRMKLDWYFEFYSALNKNFPFITFFNVSHQNRCSIWSNNGIDDALFKFSMNQEAGCFNVAITYTLAPETQEFEINFDFSERPWSEVLDECREALKPATTLSYPETAWQPVFCTWYAVHADFDSDWLRQCAKSAAKLGFSSFIVDDGWSYPEHKRVSPQTLPSWYKDIGDWRVCPEKLADFKSVVTEAQAAGLKYMLWVAPFFVGDNHINTDEKLIWRQTKSNGCCSPAGEYAAKAMEQIVNLMRDYNLDGVKIDFLDSAVADLNTPLGREANTYITELSAAIRAVKPDAMMEYRQHYISPCLLDKATQFRAGDVPFDFVENLMRIAAIRLSVGDGVPVHADPAYWRDDELDENVSRHLIAAINAVPMLSMDLDKISAGHRQIIKHWINFYKTKLPTFQKGHWTIKYKGELVSYIAVNDGREAVITLCDELRLPEAMNDMNELDEVAVLNISPSPVKFEYGEVFDCMGNKLESKYIPVGGRGLIALAR